MAENGQHQTKIIAEQNLYSPNYDGIILISSSIRIKCEKISKILENVAKFDSALETEVSVIPTPEWPTNRLIYAPTGPIDPDYDDIRVFKKAAAKGIKRAIKAGVTKPLLLLEEDEKFENASLITLLGALEALYVPIQVREFDPKKKDTIPYLGVFTHNIEKTIHLVNLANILENGRRVACDISDADPERMTPDAIQQYIHTVFSNSTIKVNVIKDLAQIKKDYPLFEAVDRAASMVDRHQGRIVFLEYNPPDAGKIEQTLLLVGKGVTYDTGGADVKVGGCMAGMSRDKCGAAAVVGFFQILKSLAPKNIRVLGGLGLVRNSIGANSYVADELLTARSGARLRVMNTDAEGRMVMADILCKFKEIALEAVNPHLFTVATLTGHALLAVGEGYTIVIDNGPAKKLGTAEKLQKAGDLIGEPIEISTLRREDLEFYRGQAIGDDIVQSNTLPSSKTARGHQGPAAFLLRASGLDKYGSGSEKPLKFSHLDIAASAGSFPHPATGSPVLTLAQAFLLK